MGEWGVGHAACCARCARRYLWLRDTARRLTPAGPIPMRSMSRLAAARCHHIDLLAAEVPRPCLRDTPHPRPRQVLSPVPVACAVSVPATEPAPVPVTVGALGPDLGPGPGPEPRAGAHARAVGLDPSLCLCLRFFSPCNTTAFLTQCARLQHPARDAWSAPTPRLWPTTTGAARHRRRLPVPLDLSIKVSFYRGAARLAAHRSRNQKSMGLLSCFEHQLVAFQTGDIIVRPCRLAL